MSAERVVHVVAAALVNADGAVLLQQRAADAHQGGLWEFPGGKLELGESRWNGLVRELNEELGITAQSARPLIAVRHDYPDRRVLLDVWRVDRWRGDPQPLEGQPLDWVRPQRLGDYALPAADRPVVSALRLPDRYLVTPSPGANWEEWFDGLEQAVRGGIDLLQIRAPELSEDAYRALAEAAISRVSALSASARVLLNAAPTTASELGAHGVHLNAARLAALATRPLPPRQLVAASCHDISQLARAAELACDFAVLSPVQPTASHPGAAGMGWKTFEQQVAAAGLPVFALGGVGPGDLRLAWSAGAQGVAGIRALWPATLSARGA